MRVVCIVSSRRVREYVYVCVYTVFIVQGEDTPMRT